VSFAPHYQADWRHCQATWSSCVMSWSLHCWRPCPIGCHHRLGTILLGHSIGWVAPRRCRWWYFSVSDWSCIALSANPSMLDHWISWQQGCRCVPPRQWCCSWSRYDVASWSLTFLVGTTHGARHSRHVGSRSSMCLLPKPLGHRC
jgi:hypothetical protein